MSLRPLPSMTLEQLDEWLFPRSVRRYQQLILDGEEVALTIDSVRFEIVGSRTTHGRNILDLRRASDGSLHELISDACGSGFSLAAGQVRPVDPAVAAIAQRTGKPVVRVGDPNFAHFIWNELDPVLRLAARVSETGLKLPIVQDFDSVLDVGLLHGVEKLPVEVLESRPSIHVGSMVVSVAAREAVLRALNAPVTPQRDATNSRRVVLGIRGVGLRSLVNEEELVVALVRRLTTRWPNVQVALDGFTFQHNNIHYSSSRERARAVNERIERIATACQPVPIVSLSGLSFEEYLPQVACATAYVTHEGTIQHKIGWFYPSIPGICLVAGPHARAVADWHLDQVDGEGRLSVLPLGLLERASVELNGRSDEAGSVDQRDQPFMCTNIDAAVDAIERLLEPELSPKQSA